MRVCWALKSKFFSYVTLTVHHIHPKCVQKIPVHDGYHNYLAHQIQSFMPKLRAKDQASITYEGLTVSKSSCHLRACTKLAIGRLGRALAIPYMNGERGTNNKITTGINTVMDPPIEALESDGGFGLYEIFRYERLFSYFQSSEFRCMG